MRVIALLSLLAVAAGPALAEDDTGEGEDTGEEEEGTDDTGEDDEDDEEEEEEWIPTFNSSDAAGEEGGCAVVSAPASALGLGLAVLSLGWRRED